MTWNALLSRWRRDDRGNVAYAFAASVVPLLVGVGAAVDYSVAASARAELQAAADAAVLAAAQAAPNTLANVKSVGEKVFKAHPGAGSASISLSQPEASVTRASVTMKVNTAFMSLVGINSMTVHVVSEARAMNSGAIEVALALDTTGSMVNDMPALRTAATNLTNALFNSATGNAEFKMSVVPFVAAVNPGRTVLEADNGAMLDVAGQSRWHAQIMEWRWIAVAKGCTPKWGGGGGGGGGPGSGGTGAELKDDNDIFGKMHKFASALISVRAAQAQVAGGVTPNTLLPLKGNASGATKKWVPTGFNQEPKKSWTGNCDWLVNPGTISHTDLFNRVPKTTTTGAAWAGWKGCVEARPSKADGATLDYAVTDDPPTSDANSKFVPYFWMDESDKFANWVPAFNNNWLPDGTLKNGVVDSDPTGKNAWNFADMSWERTFNLLKYNGVNKPNIVETAPDTRGPNKACPDQVLPLTNDKTAVLNRINSLSFWNGGGTIIAEGVMWGWRTLSPKKPFANAKPYDEKNQKVLVLMSDGKNEIGENGRDQWGGIDGSPMYSDYTAYGYLRYGRYPSETFAAATTMLNDRTAAACVNAKKAGITIYTVLFRETDPAAINLMKNCASKSENAFIAANGADLSAAFGQIGAGISKLRLSK